MVQPSPATADRVFVTLLRGPGIGSQSGAARRRAGNTTLFVVPARQATLAEGIDSPGIDSWVP
jgi:hypothetical protein